LNIFPTAYLINRETGKKLRMKFVELNGNSRKPYHPQRLNERTPYGKKTNEDKPFVNNELRRNDSPNLQATVSQIQIGKENDGFRYSLDN
jgi:methyl coenzyme M reductase subunit D